MRFDTIIIGAGIIGTSTAYYLQKYSPKQKILLIDKNSKIAGGNTSRSAALYRNLFSSRTSQVLSASSIGFYETIADKIGLKNLGYLWMFSQDDWKKSQKGLQNLNDQSETFEILSPKEFPKNLQLNFNSSDDFPAIHQALYGHRCGSLSAINLAKYYAKQFEDLGGKIALEKNIQKLSLSEEERHFPPWSGIKLLSIMDQNRDEYLADDFLFTTGAWTNDLLAPIGIASQIYPKKRQLYTLKLDSTQIVSNPKESTPILILPTGGVYVKPILQNGIIMVGCANELGNPYQMNIYPPAAEQEYFEFAIKPILQYYFPKLKEFKLFSKWAGYYAYYWPDKNPVIEKVSNIQWISGTSGSGIMKADAIGRISAAKVLGLEKTELFDGTKFKIDNLSLKKRAVDAEELII